MNLGEIKTSVKRLFGDESGAQITDADIVRWANDGQVDIVRKTECLQKKTEFNVTANDESYDLPADSIRLRRVELDGKALSRVELEELDNVVPDRNVTGTSSGSPVVYYVWGQTLWLYPKPETAGTSNLDLFYLKRPAALAVDADIPEIPVHMHEDIVRYCLARAKELDEEMEQARNIFMDYETRVMLSRDEAQNPENDTYPAVRILPGDDW